MEFGQATPTKAFECKDRKKVVHKVYDNERYDVLAKALRFANQYIFTGGINVKSVEKEDDTLQVAKKLQLQQINILYKGGHVTILINSIVVVCMVGYTSLTIKMK